MKAKQGSVPITAMSAVEIDCWRSKDQNSRHATRSAYAGARLESSARPQQRAAHPTPVPMRLLARQTMADGDFETWSALRTTQTGPTWLELQRRDDLI